MRLGHLFVLHHSTPQDTPQRRKPSLSQISRASATVSYPSTSQGVPAKIKSERIEYLGEDGQLITESYKDFSAKRVQEEFASLDDFIREWNDADKKKN